MTQDEDGNAGWVSSHDQTALVSAVRNLASAQIWHRPKSGTEQIRHRAMFRHRAVFRADNTAG
jgi:hypothetical protein